MGWHTNRLDFLEDELLRKDEEIAELKHENRRLRGVARLPDPLIDELIAELKHENQRLREELVAHHVPYCAELEDQKRMHKEEE